MEIGWVSSIDRFCARPRFEAGLRCDRRARRVARGVKTRAFNIYPAPQSGTRCRRIANFINDIADQTQ